MKGHILILTANILFGISMPVFKYLLTSNIPPEAITIMRAGFACMMSWLVSFFHTKGESIAERFGNASCLRPLWGWF
jgi:hypothetical protein